MAIEQEAADQRPVIFIDHRGRPLGAFPLRISTERCPDQGSKRGIVDEFRFGPESSPWPLGHRGFKFPVDAELLAFLKVLAY